MELYDPKKLSKIRSRLIRRNETLAVAESVTAGLLQMSIAQAEFASDFYQGGITTYNLGQKYKHLEVEPIHATATNSVSQKVAAEMAKGVCKLFSSDWGIGVTGYATPVEESGGKVFAFFAIAYKGKLVAQHKRTTQPDTPFLVQLKFVHAILDTLNNQISR